MKRRVAITAIGMVTPLGESWHATRDALLKGKSGIRRMDAWDNSKHLRTRLGAPLESALVDSLPRKVTRTMGRVSFLSTVATAEAIAQAGLSDADIRGGGVALAYGSTNGSSSANEEWVKKTIATGGFLGLAATGYLKFMSHTTAANLGLHFGFRGRVLTTCSACVSASQAIGYAYEQIKYGIVDAAVAGGAEELHVAHAGVFDIMMATSQKYNDSPDSAPRPFDVERDGIVVGEGAGTFVLEEWERAKRLGRNILAEVIGFGTNCDGEHITTPSSEGMAGAMRASLADAAIDPSAIDYVNAHATATQLGDIAESRATREVFQREVPISSLKGNFGHTLGGCGAIEAGMCVSMLREGFLAPTRNLTSPDPACAPLDYVRELREQKVRTIMSNKFAFGGLNTSLILRGVE
jgi:3-oxoacyl-[acyl-carrier-protein] synthase II